MMTDHAEFKRHRKDEKHERKQARKAYKKPHDHIGGGIGEVFSREGKVFVEGITNIHGGEFDELFIEGVCNCSSDIVAKKLDVEGIFNCTGRVESEKLSCEGTAQIKSDVRAKEMSVEGVMEIKGRLEADHIMCWGVIHATEEVSADVVEAKGIIHAREIVGDKIIIRSEVRTWLRRFLHRYEVINFIEATNVELHRVNAKVVNGHDIHIGQRCVIDKIDCSGTLYVHPTAEIGEVVGNYELVTE